MATRLDGNVRKATANTVTAMKRSAENRRCPNCDRKSAMGREVVTENSDFLYVRERECRWCGYAEAWIRSYHDDGTSTVKSVKVWPDGRRQEVER